MPGGQSISVDKHNRFNCLTTQIIFQFLLFVCCFFIYCVYICIFFVFYTVFSRKDFFFKVSILLLSFKWKSMICAGPICDFSEPRFFPITPTSCFSLVLVPAALISVFLRELWAGSCQYVWQLVVNRWWREEKAAAPVVFPKIPLMIRCGSVLKGFALAWRFTWVFVFGFCQLKFFSRFFLVCSLITF